MAVAKDDDDARRTLIRFWCGLFWGEGPSQAEQDYILQEHRNPDGTWTADLALAGIYDHQKAVNMRAKRGW